MKKKSDNIFDEKKIHGGTMFDIQYFSTKKTKVLPVLTGKTLEVKLPKKIDCKVVPTEAVNDEERKIFTAVASTKAIDRAGEVLFPAGCKFDDFLKNPVLLDCHNYAADPIGKILSVDVSKEAVKINFVFADTDRGNELQYKYEKGYMKAFSVGFYYRKYIFVDDNTPEEFEVIINGEKEKVKLSDFASRPWLLTLEWELLEVSTVPIGCNQEALLEEMKVLVHSMRSTKSTPGAVFKTDEELEAILTEMLTNEGTGEGEDSDEGKGAEGELTDAPATCSSVDDVAAKTLDALDAFQKSLDAQTDLMKQVKIRLGVIMEMLDDEKKSSELFKKLEKALKSIRTDSDNNRSE